MRGERNRRLAPGRRHAYEPGVDHDPSLPPADSAAHTAFVPGHRALLKLAGPNVASRLGVMAMGLIDTIVLGHYSARELGYMALGWAPTSTVLVSAIGLLFGIQVLTARHLGADEPEMAGTVLRRGLRYAFGIGVAATILLFFGGPILLHHTGIEADLADGASHALRILSLSLILYLIADCFWFWLEALGQAHVPMVVMWGANIIDLALALWLVPGNSPFPVSGAIAAAWVTFFARLFLMLALAVYVLRWPKARAYGVFTRPVKDRAAEREQRRIGYASGLSYAIEAGAFAGLSFVAAQMGTMAVAAWAVVMNLLTAVFMIPMGIATATAILVSRSVGAHSPGGVRRSYRMGMAWGTGIAVALCAVVLVAPRETARIYSTDPVLLAASAFAIQLIALSFLADAAQVISANALRARGDIWWATRMHMVSYLAIMLPAAWFLGVARGFGLAGISGAVVLASAVSGAALVWRFLALRDAGVAVPARA